MDLLVEDIDGGRALRGFLFYHDGNNVHLGQCRLEHGKEVLLESPMHPNSLITRSSGRESVSQIRWFSSAQESSSFFEAVKKNGWNMAGLIEANLWEVNASTSMSLNKEATREEMTFMEAMVKEAWITRSLYIPMGSFQIPRNQMRLSKSAMNQVKNIEGIVDAIRFLTRYGSHVSSNRYILGGFFYEEVHASAGRETSRKSLKDGTTSRGLLSTGTSLMTFTGVRASGGREKAASHHDRKSSSYSTYRYEKHIRCLGPMNVTTEEEFRKKLDNEHFCWAIIDKDADHGADDLVSVWIIILDFIKKETSIAFQDRRILLMAAKLLCETWINQVESRPSYSFVTQDPFIQMKDAVLKNAKKELHNVEGYLNALNNVTCHQPSSRRASSQPIILPQIQWGSCPIEDLINELRILDLGLGDHLQPHISPTNEEKLADKVSFLLTSCIHNLNKRCSVPSRSDLQEQLNKIMSVVTRYGFREDGNYFNPIEDKRAVECMIEDLEDKMFNRDSTKDSLEIMAAHHWEWDIRPVEKLEELSPANNMTYVGTVLVDKPCEQLRSNTDEARHRQALLIDNLRRHLKSFDIGNDPAPLGIPMRRRGRTAAPATPQTWCPFKDLVDLMHASDFRTQVAISRFLLQQRMAAPLTACSTNEISGYKHWAEALSFVDVKLLNEKTCYVGLDGTLPRVAFLSKVQDTSMGSVSRSSVVAGGACHCIFPSRHINRLSGNDSGSRFPVVEVGIGFIEDLPFMALHVNGPYDGIIDFVAAAVDVIVLEVGKPILELDSSFPDSCKGIDKVQWMMSLEDRDDYDQNLMISGTETFLVRAIQDILSDVIQAIIEDPQKSMRIRTNLVELCNSQNTFRKGFQAFRPFALLEESLRDRVDSKIISECKNLQSTYESEATMFFRQLKLTDAEKTMMKKECRKKSDQRRELVSKSLENPLLRMFYRIISQPNTRTRMISLLWFQRELSHKMDVSKRGNQFLRMIHLWRELCHIFVSFPSNQGLIPKLAAQHLMDGYPIEILDGDANMFCDLWVTSVLKELQALTKKALDRKDARIFVLSAMGVQSSGKSTLLNLMFGAQLVTSVGRCTRGVFIQLVPSTRTDYYDYVLIVDTEGLRSPDFPIGAVHDNRLATFGLLPSDASIFMVSNEDDSGLKEVLPMVLLGFKGSAMAEKSGGRIKTKMFFVYRSVDTNDRGKLNQHKEKLRNHLKNAAEEVSNMGRNAFSSNEVQANATSSSSPLEKILFDDLHIDNDDKKSDVRCMGNLKKGSKPPEDVPDWEYGKEVSELREYIHRRIVEDPSWTPTTIQEWSDNLSRVWDCICKADFELNFRSAVQCSAYQELQQTLTEGPRRAVSEAYMEALARLENSLRAQKDGTLSHEDDIDGGIEEESLSTWYQFLEVSVETPVMEQTDILRKLLSNKRWSIWQMDELKNWNSFLSSTKAKFKMRVKDMAQGILKYEATALKLEAEMKRDIMKQFRDHQTMDNDTRITTFNSMFEKIMKSAERKFRPQTSFVATYVADAYKRTGIEHEFITDISLGSTVFSKVANRLAPWLGPQSNKLEYVTGNLIHCLDVGLKDCTQYSDAMVEAIITSTKKILTNGNLTRAHQLDGHRFVKKILTERMEDIQRKWDAQHNIAEKLRGAKHRLNEFFNSVVDGIGTTERLWGELKNLLWDEVLIKRPKIISVRDVSGIIKGHSWARDWTKLSACLDLHLMALIDKGPTHEAQLLGFVQDGSEHYARMIRILVGVEVEARFQETRKKYVSSVCIGLRNAAQACAKGTQESIEKLTTIDFLNIIKSELESSLGGHEMGLHGYDLLGAYLWNHIYPSYTDYEVAQQNILDKEYLFNREQGKVELFCKSLEEASLKHVDLGTLKDEMTEGVIERLVGDDTEHVKLRCSAKCPGCGSQCMHEIGHPLSTVKHDSIHQISGLTGWHDKRTNRLWHNTCYIDLLKGKHFVYKGKYHKAKHFNKVFPDWMNPIAPTREAILSLKLRDFIFCKYQAALVKQFNTLPCRDENMPITSGLDEIRKSIENRLSSKSEFQRFYEAFKDNH